MQTLSLGERKTENTNKHTIAEEEITTRALPCSLIGCVLQLSHANMFRNNSWSAGTAGFSTKPKQHERGGGKHKHAALPWLPSHFQLDAVGNRSSNPREQVRVRAAQPQGRDLRDSSESRLAGKRESDLPTAWEIKSDSAKTRRRLVHLITHLHSRREELHPPEDLGGKKTAVFSSTPRPNETERLQPSSADYRMQLHLYLSSTVSPKAATWIKMDQNYHLKKP